MLGRIVMLRRLMMLWWGMVMVSTIMTIVCWCASFHPSCILKDLSHDLSLPPASIILHTVGPHTVLSNRPCRVAHVILATVGARAALSDLRVAQHQTGQNTDKTR